MEKKIKIGLYGSNGHQIHKKLINHKNAELVAVCKIDKSFFTFENGYAPDNIKFYDTLEEMLVDDSIDLISLCSPKREVQARDAIICLNAKKHVYAERPAAFSIEDLENILQAARENDRCFHEYADTVFSSLIGRLGKLYCPEQSAMWSRYMHKNHILCALQQDLRMK